MATLSYKLYASKKGDLPVTPFVHIILKSYSSREDRIPLLSPQLMTDREIDESVNYLKSQLDHIARLSKKALKRARFKTLENLKN